MEHERPGVRVCLDGVQHGASGAAAVNGQDPSAGAGTGLEYVLEDGSLVRPMLAELRCAVEPDLTNISGLRDEIVEET